MQMYLPFCGIAISNAQLFAASRKEYERSRVSTGPLLTMLKLAVFAASVSHPIFQKQQMVTL